MKHGKLSCKTKGSLNRAFAVICSLVLVAGLFPVVAFAEGEQAPQNTKRVQVQVQGDADHGTVTATVDNVSVTIGDGFDVADGQTVSFTITADEGYVVDTHRGVKVERWQNGNQATPVFGQKVSDTKYTAEFTAVAETNYTLICGFESQQQGGNQGGNQGQQGGNEANQGVNKDQQGSNQGQKGNEKTRQITLTVDQASAPLLADTVEFIVGYGDESDVRLGVEDNGKPVMVTENTKEKMLLSFAIDSDKYFIPYVNVNGQKIETFDTGMKTDEGKVIIGVKLTGDAAAVDTFKVDLTVGAVANVNSQSKKIEGAEAKYMMVEEGKAGLSSTDVALAIDDTAVDTKVEGAVATFDLGVKVDGATASELDSPLNITMTLDKNTFTEQTYKVVRNHEGQTQELDATYDPQTGAISFSSDKYSSYSIVGTVKKDGGSSNTNTNTNANTNANANTNTNSNVVANTNTNTNTTSSQSASSSNTSSSAKTGDPLNVMLFVGLALVAAGALVIIAKRRRN